MSTDVAVRPAAAPVALPDLEKWAYAARQVHQIAVSLASTSFVPRMMQNRPEEVTGVILAGRELGLSPMSALRSIDIIEGTPAIRAHALRGLVQAHGHEVWVEDSTDTRAVVCGRRAGSVHVERAVWTIDRARKAGLAGKKVWQAHPSAMLIARATSEVCRLVAADVLLGMPYTVEELTDDVAQDAPPVEVRKSGKRTMQREPVAIPAPTLTPVVEPTPEPDLCLEEGTAESCPVDESEAVENVKPDVVELITGPQRRKLHAAFRDAGIEDRTARLDFASGTLGRAVQSSNELSKVEAGQVIDALEALPDEVQAIENLRDGGLEPQRLDEDWPDTPPVGGGRRV